MFMNEQTKILAQQMAKSTWWIVVATLLGSLGKLLTIVGIGSTVNSDSAIDILTWIVGLCVLVVIINWAGIRALNCAEKELA